MTRRRTLARMLLLGTLIAGGLVATSAPAAAVFHLMVISEVSDGTPLDMNLNNFVELQMYASGQNLIDGKQLVIYSSAGSPQTTVNISGDVPNGENQQTILIGSGVGQDKFHVFDIPTTGGAVCFKDPSQPPVDCVAWGTFNNASAQLPVGTPFPGGIPTENSLQRNITPGCPTLLEASDDTNNSANDFRSAPPTPRNNSATPTETPCAPGTPGGAAILQNLKAKVKGGRAVITGSIQPPAPGQQVKLTFFANGSPLRKIAKKSATLNADSKFKKKFRVPTDSTRCKVKVAFQGQAMGQKKFKC
jgi:hypothetical protein